MEMLNVEIVPELELVDGCGDLDDVLCSSRYDWFNEKLP